MKKTLISLASFLLGIGLIYVGFEVILGPEQSALLISKPISFHLYSCLLAVPIYLLGGLERFILLRTIYSKTISVYDVITLPFVISLWGYLIPIQGSYIYNLIYLKTKYKIDVENTTSIYLVSLSVTFVLAGMFGLAYNYFLHFNGYLVLISILAFLNPLIIFMAEKFIKNLHLSSLPMTGKFFESINIIVADYIAAFDYKRLIAFLIGTNVFKAVIVAFWSLRIAVNYNLDLSFVQLLLLAFLINLTLLVKLTPGNLGINQFTAAGIIVLLGASPVDGFTLSLYQAAIFILTSTIVGSVFSIINMKSFSIKNLVN